MVGVTRNKVNMRTEKNTYIYTICYIHIHVPPSLVITFLMSFLNQKWVHGLNLPETPCLTVKSDVSLVKQNPTFSWLHVYLYLKFID